MTPAHASLEQLNALVDGEGDPGVASHVGGCSSCAGVVRSLRAVRASVAEVPPLAPAETDRLVAAAVAARAVPLPRRHTRVPVPAGIAAALVALLGLGALLAGTARDGGPEDRVASGGAAATAEGDANDEAAAEAFAPRIAGGTAAGTADPELVALQQRLAEQAGAGRAADATMTAAALPCATEAESELGSPADRGWTLRWHGEDAVVHAEDDRRQAVVMRAAGCEVLVVLQF